MEQLKIVLIDVAWGDSIFLEAIDNNGTESYALIDSNDTTNLKSSLIYLKRYFQRKFGTSSINKPIFDWVMLSHAHSDHGEGLKEIMKFFGTKNFYYPKSNPSACLAHLQQYVNRAKIFHQAVDEKRIFPDLGNAQVNILSPDKNNISHDENNNSIVLSIQQDNMTCILTGDAEEEVWKNIKSRIPSNTVFFKVPHHGSINGSLDSSGYGTWTSNCPNSAILGISTHNRPYNHPHQPVLDLFKENGFNDVVRTDDNHHIEIVIKNNNVTAKYSR